MFAAKNELLTRPNGGYNLTRSLRFRSSATAYLSRTFVTPTNNTTWTYSCWVKRATLSTIQSIFSGGDSDFRFDVTTNLFSMSKDGTVVVSSTAVFRDPSAWMHVVLVSNGTTVKAYVNSTEAFSYTGTNPDFNSAVGHTIGRYAGGATEYLDGYLAEVNFIDGQALTASSFGAFSPYNQWLPKKYAGTYGTNGFYLPFTNNASTTTLGYDFSPQGNNWTTNNISVTAGSTYDSMTDVPTLTSATAANYCVLNALDKTTGTLSNGNLTWYNAASSQACVRSTMAIPRTGKWYWEAYLTNPVGANSSGIALSTFGMASFIGDTNSWAYHTNGYKYVSGVGTAGFGSVGVTGNIFSYDYDSSTGTLRGYHNGTLQGTIVTGLAAADYFAAYSSYGGGQWDANFGQRPFNYSPPSGFVALNTFNL